MTTLRELVVLLVVSAMVNAQTWTISAQAPVVGSASATVWSGGLLDQQTAQVPIGPVAQGTLLTCSANVTGASSSTGGGWQVLSTGASPSFRVNSGASASNPAAGLASAGMDVVLLVRFASAVPVAGRLHLQGSGGAYPPGSTNSVSEVDVGNDGTIDFTYSISSGPASIFVPVVLHAGTLDVRVQLRASAGVALLAQSETMLKAITATLVPSVPTISNFDWTGAGASLAWSVPSLNQLTLTTAVASQTPLLLVFGSQPVVVPLFPGVTQLVGAIDAVFATGTMSLQLPLLPAGTALYVQGLVLDGAGAMVTTQSVRALWP